MSDNSRIEWTDATWSPTTGCDRVSPGCDHCYALTLAKRLKAMGNPKYQNDGDPRTSGPGFGVTTHSRALELPLRWRKPKRIFVNSMSDLFHEAVPDEFIAQVFAVMALTPRHTYQILTKRHARMRALLSRNLSFTIDVLEAARAIDPSCRDLAWPLPNVWLGVSVEDQKWADIRIPALLDTSAAVRFLSCEPLLGHVYLGKHLELQPVQSSGRVDFTGIGWVIVGGESGAKARPMAAHWATSLRDECRTAGVPFFFKQAGAVLAREWGCTDRKGHNPDEWPEPLPREMPDTMPAVVA